MITLKNTDSVDSGVEEAIGVGKKFIEKVVLVLQKYTRDGSISLIEVNSAALWLLNVMIEAPESDEAQLYVCKPLFVKAKTTKKSALAPFIEVEKLSTMERLVREDGLEDIPLVYPVAHLQHLYNLGYVEITGIERIQARVLQIRIYFRDGNCHYSTQPLKIDECELQSLKEKHGRDLAKAIFQIRDILKKRIAIIHNESGKSVYVRACRYGAYPHYCYKYIISDVDIHNMGEKIDCVSAHAAVFDTSMSSGQEALRSAVMACVGLKDEEKTIFSKVPKTIGQIRLRDYIILCRINSELGHPHSYDALSSIRVLRCIKVLPDMADVGFNAPVLEAAFIQHAPTCSYKPVSLVDATVTTEYVETGKFPAVDMEKLYGVIFSGGQLIICSGKEILLFYYVMRQLGIDYEVHDIWKEQLIGLEGKYGCEDLVTARMDMFKELLAIGCISINSLQVAYAANFTHLTPRVKEAIEMVLKEEDSLSLEKQKTECRLGV